MSQVRKRRQNNLRAGIFVTLTLALGLAVFSILTNAWEEMFRTTIAYRVSFPVEEGIGSLASGSKVRLGGVLIGEVSNVTPRVENDSPTSWIDIQFEIEEQFILYENASLHAKSGLLGTSSWLSITDVGNGQVATIETELRGSTDTMIAQILGREAEINISKSIEALRKISEAISNEGGMLSVLFGFEEAKTLKEAIESAKSGLIAIDKMMTSANVVWPEWEDSVTSILSDTKKLPSEMSETLQRVREALQDVREKILPKIEQGMISFKNSMSSLESMSKTYQSNSPKWASRISDIVANVDRMTVRAKDAIDDISASPWRLVYRPKDRQIAYEQLNKAAWQLVNALSDLRYSAEVLRAASESQDAPPEAKAIADLLEESEEMFEKARDAIRERMLDF